MKIDNEKDLNSSESFEETFQLAKRVLPVIGNLSRDDFEKAGYSNTYIESMVDADKIHLIYDDCKTRLKCPHTHKFFVSRAKNS